MSQAPKSTQSNNSESREERGQFENLAWIWFWSGVGVVVIYLFIVVWQHADLGSPFNLQEVGAVGDLIGGIVGSLWALTGVFLFYQALREQRRDFQTNLRVLQVQQDDYKLQLMESELTRGVLEHQSRSLWYQQFENTLFNLLESLNTVRAEFAFSTEHLITWKTVGGQNPYLHLGAHVEVSGQDAFYECYGDFRRLYWQGGGVNEIGVDMRSLADIYAAIFVEEPEVPGLDHPLERIKHQYQLFYEVYFRFLSHYFRSIYHILKFLKETEDKSEFELKDYSGIFQAQLSASELGLIFYNGLCFPKMKRLIEHFKFVNNLNKDELADPDEHFNLYDGMALKTRREMFDQEK